jgi:beta-glucosidase-like glycosyl hydrolase
VVIYNALTGDSFCTSSRDMTGILRRNMLDRFVVGACGESVVR